MAGRPQRRSQVRLVLALAAAASISQFAVAPPVAAASDLLPDLKMAPAYDFEIEHGRKGKVRLRFGTIVWNIGQGPLEVRGSGREGRKMTILRQVLKRSDGGTRTIAGPPDIYAFFSGDHHDHWHISKFVIVSLFPMPTGPEGPAPSAVRHLRKIGFCLTDLVRVPLALRPPDSGKRAYPYTGCGNSDSVRFKMGISVGWGDDYKSWFAHQSVDITGLAAGNYRMCITPNPGGAWLESTITNNSSWVDLSIDIAHDNLAVLQRGETECQPGETFTPTVTPSGPGIYGGLRTS
jgi:lysyl oxidase